MSSLQSTGAALLCVRRAGIPCDRSLLKEPLEGRRRVLAELVKGKAAPIALSESLDASPKDLVRVANEFGSAKVRNDFVPLVRREVASRFKGLEIDTCPFANLREKKRTQRALTKKEMKNCVWLRPELVAQIEFTEWTPDGHLRHSKFVGLREDKYPRDVEREG
jgi:ATP-dependent DNA ligase